MKKLFTYSLVAIPVLSIGLISWVEPDLPKKPTPAVASVATTTSDTEADAPKLRADIIPHSPDVEAMAKYGVLPVTLYSGLPQISVPLFELKTPGLTIPFALSYHYNGFKPTETATWCGLGWSLQGGGSIARIIKGFLDGDKTGNNYNDFVTMDALKTSQSFLRSVGLGNVDTEPDLYIFNIGDYSGKFIMIGNQAYLFPHQNLSITKTIFGFKMIDDKGNTYLFEEPETSVSKNHVVSDHTSAWHISSIITTDKRDTINYFYTPYNYRQPTTFTDSYSINKIQNFGPNTNGHNFSRVYVEGDHISAKVLWGVRSSRSGKIRFKVSSSDRLDLTASTGARILDSVMVFRSDGRLLKQVVLVHDYFGESSRLKLKETYEKRYDQSTISQHYSFEYQGEDEDLNVDQSSIDYWGYYNARDNEMLFTSQSLGVTSALRGFANRDPDAGRSSLGIIKKITYPTGGNSTFDYEQNKAGHLSVSTTYTNAVQRTDVSYIDFNTIDINGVSASRKSQILPIRVAQTISIEYGDNDELNAPHVPVIQIHRDALSGPVVYSSPLYRNTSYKKDTTLFLDEGTYVTEVLCDSYTTYKAPDDTDDTIIGTYAEVHYKDYAVVGTLTDAGGLRISEISSYEKDSTTPALIKQYTYDDADPAPNGIASRSQRDGCTNTEVVFEYAYASVGSALSDLTENQFYYRTVTEASQDSRQTGMTVYTFNALNPQLRDVKLTSQTEIKYADNKYTPVKKHTYQYTRIDKNVFVGMRVDKTKVAGIGCTFIDDPDNTDPAIPFEIYEESPDTYSLISDYTLLVATDEIDYYDSGLHNVTTHTDYHYDNPSHNYPTKITATNSKGETLIQELKYPLDYNYNNCVSPASISDSFKNDLNSAVVSAGARWASLKTALTVYQPYSDHKTDFDGLVNSFNVQGKFKDDVKSAVSHRDDLLDEFDSCRNSIIYPDPNSHQAPHKQWQVAIAWMQLNNVVSPVIEKYVSIKKADGNEYLLSATRNEYTILNSNAVEPLAIQQTEIATSVLKSDFVGHEDSYYKPQLTFYYDQDLNLVGQQKKNDVPVTYIYGYRQAYPVAEIKNATFNSVLTALSLSASQYKIESRKSRPSATYLSKISSLRQNLPKSIVTTYQFDPMVGMTLMSDPNNMTTHYEYDQFRRLVTVKDNDNNILKSYEYHYKF